MRAQSRYKQVKIVLTEEADPYHRGRVVISMRVSVKPLLDQWYDHQTVLSVAEGDLSPLDDLWSVYRALLVLLQTPPLPVVDV
jgi:hypothetical protein